MNQKFEKELKGLKKEEMKLPDTVRNKLDIAYEEIKTSKSVNRTIKRSPMFLPISVIVLLMIIGISPITQAVSNYLKFGTFFSEKLTKENFVAKENRHSENNGIRIKLEESYMDQKQLGLHFSIQLPENSKLLSSKISYYSLGFTIKDNDNRTIIFSNDSHKSSMVGTYTQNQYLDKKNNTVEMTYLLNNYQSEFLSSDEQVIEITKLTGTVQGNSKKVKHGFSNVTTVSTEGKWTLPLKASNIEKFKGISYTGTIKESGQGVTGEAFPTMFKIETEPLELAKNTTDIKLISDNQGKRKEYTLLSSSQENGKLIWYFDYSDYDEADEVQLQIKGSDVVILNKSEN